MNKRKNDDSKGKWSKVLNKHMKISLQTCRYSRTISNQGNTDLNQ